MNLESNFLHALIPTMREEYLECIVVGAKQDMLDDILKFYGDEILESETLQNDLEFIVQSIESVI